MFDSTLIVWHGEFGRLPISERMDGRDHNANGFSVWLAGGGVKGGTIVGATDQYGYQAVENPKTVYDLHATILHLLGLDHEKLTYRFNGRDMRLTDVHGNVIKEIVGVSACTPACAHCPSCAPVTPLTPTAPTSTPSTISGTPPSSGMNPSIGSSAVRPPLTSSSRPLVGPWKYTAVRALRIAMSIATSFAPSIR